MIDICTLSFILKDSNTFPPSIQFHQPQTPSTLCKINHFPPPKCYGQKREVKLNYKVISKARAIMQCQSFLPVHQSQYDLNIDASGAATPLFNNGNGGVFRSVNYNDFVSSPAVPRGPVAHKDILRQTMILHEVTFKDQVQELHRLYRRQKELMGEIRSKEVYMNQLQIEVQSSNSTSAIFSGGCGQHTPCSIPFTDSHGTPSATRRDNIQVPPSSERESKPPSTPLASQNGDTLNDLHILECKGKRIRGKLLDLELPAETYIDSDEEESLQDAKFSDGFTPSILFSNKRTKVEVESDITASTENKLLLLSQCSFSGINTNLADLNEPLETSDLEESDGDKKTNSSLEILERNLDQFDSSNITLDGAAEKLTVKSSAQSDSAKSEIVTASPGRKASYNLGKNSLVVQALPSLNNQLPYSKGAKVGGRQKGLFNKFSGNSRCSPNVTAARSLKSIYSESKSKVPVVCMSSKTPDSNCIDLNSAEVAISEITEDETVKKSKRCRVIDINLPCDPMTDEEPLIEDDLVGNVFKNSAQLNLNFCKTGNELQAKPSSLVKTRLDIDLEAPISPEVEECPPPRGDSEENQPEEGCDLLVELSKIAAEVIISFSSSKCQSYPEIVDLNNGKALDSGNLEWFAGLVDSLSDDLEKDVDDFEAMTLELCEMKVEEYGCKNIVQVYSETCSVPLSCQTRKGRTRRSKRKDFQKEVLPSLSSLSRYEVTEDIQLIEGLMEAAGTPLQLSRTRRACRMGRKPRVAKQQTFDDNAHVPELRAHVSWGVVNRRPRGRRSPASSTAISKWFDYSS